MNFAIIALILFISSGLVNASERVQKLLVNSSSGVHLTFVDEKGRSTGSGATGDIIPESSFSDDGDGAGTTLEIENPAAGKYLLKVNPGSRRPYEFSVVISVVDAFGSMKRIFTTQD